MTHGGTANAVQATPLWPVCIVTFLASIGTGVLWNGIGFVAESAYGYGRVGSFGLSFVFGVAYVVVALSSGWFTRSVASLASPRALLAFIFLGQALVAPLVLIPRSPWTLWVVGGTVSVLSALQWPLVEGYIAGGRTRAAMRRAMGAWNLVWMGAVTIALALLGTILDGERALLAMAILAPINLVCIVTLAWFGKAPGPHVHEHHDPVPASYVSQLASARVLLPVSYVVVSAISPALPYLLSSRGAEAGWRTPIAATWLAARFLTVLVLFRTHGWHGRWSSLLVAGVLCAGGFAFAVLAPNLVALALGLAAFGVGQGAVYYMAIYYAMAVGEEKVEAASVHESLIGVGYAIGPLAGIASFALAATPAGGNVAFVAVVLAILALGSIPAITPYRSWKRRAASAPTST